MPSFFIYCPACSKQHSFAARPTANFNCVQCGAKINPNLPDLQNPYQHQSIQTSRPNQQSSGSDYSGVVGFFIAVIIMGGIIWAIYFGDKSKPTTSNNQPETSNYQSNAQHQRTKDTSEVYVVPPPETIAQIQHTQAVSDSSNHSLSTLIDSSGVTFDESFRPIAAIRLHNTTGREIDQVVLRFTFTTADEQDGSISTIAANEYSSYSEITGALKPGDSNTWKILIPPTQRKNFDMPTISVVKVRYFDGSISTDDR